VKVDPTGLYLTVGVMSLPALSLAVFFISATMSAGAQGRSMSPLSVCMAMNAKMSRRGLFSDFIVNLFGPAPSREPKKVPRFWLLVCASTVLAVAGGVVFVLPWRIFSVKELFANYFSFSCASFISLCALGYLSQFVSRARLYRSKRFQEGWLDSGLLDIHAPRKGCCASKSEEIITYRQHFGIGEDGIKLGWCQCSGPARGELQIQWQSFVMLTVMAIGKKRISGCSQKRISYQSLFYFVSPWPISTRAVGIIRCAHNDGVANFRCSVL
jgi:hypothetical protein